MNFFYLLVPLMFQAQIILASDSGIWIPNENFELYKEDYENYQLIITKIRDLKAGIQIDIFILLEKFLNHTLYYHGYSDDEISMLIQSEEDLVEFLMRVLTKEAIIDIYRCKDNVNPHLQSFMRDLKERYPIAADLFQEEYIKKVEEIYARCNLDELSDYIILLKENLYYEGFLREPDIDFKANLKSRDDQFKYLGQYFTILARFTKFYKFILSVNKFAEIEEVGREIFYNFEIDQLWKFKEILMVYEKGIACFLDTWIDVSKWALIFKLFISPQKSKVFVLKEEQELERKLQIEEIFGRFSDFLQELRWVDAELPNLIQGNNIENVLAFLLDEYFSYEKYKEEKVIFELGFRYLTLIGFDYSQLEMRLKRINFYLAKAPGRMLKMKLFQTLRDPLFQPPSNIIHLDFEKTLLFYKILSNEKLYLIYRNYDGTTSIYEKGYYWWLWSMFQMPDAYLTAVFNTYYKDEFFDHDMRIVKEKTVETLHQMIIQKYPFEINDDSE
jgi:hypothetical protein